MKSAVLVVTVSLLAISAAQAQAPIQVVVPAGVQQNPAGFYNLNNDVLVRRPHQWRGALCA
jgi:hypothetical protein